MANFVDLACKIFYAVVNLIVKHRHECRHCGASLS